MPGDLARLVNLASDRHILDFGAVEALTAETKALNAEADRMIARASEIEAELASLAKPAPTTKGSHHG